jgi:hypothetical protein
VIRTRVFHPVLFGIGPILFLYTQNLHQVSFDEVLRSLLVAMLASILGCILVNCLFCDIIKSGIIVSVFLSFFFSYGYGWYLAKGLTVQDSGIDYFCTYFLPSVWLAGFVSLAYGVCIHRNALVRVNSLLNVIGAFLVLIHLSSFIAVLKANRKDISHQHCSERLVVTERAPDIYYIVLDSYARDDILWDLFGFDNRQLMEFLTQKGFYVAKESHSNYSQTYLSLASELNFTYLDPPSPGGWESPIDRKPEERMIKNNEVFRLLKQAGYRIVSFSTSDSVTDIRDADIHLSPSWNLNEFENALLLTTPLGAIRSLSMYYRGLRRQSIEYIFDSIPKTTQLKAPIFVFAHILSPHPPFLFDENGKTPDDGGRELATFITGNHVTEDVGYRSLYKQQVAYVTKRIQEAIDLLLKRSPDIPIVILQSDHGSGASHDMENIANTDLDERMSILNACLLPGDGSAKLYPSITPVNIFRIVFDHYFGTRLGIIKDESFYSTYSFPYNFVNVSDRLRKRRKRNID